MLSKQSSRTNNIKKAEAQKSYPLVPMAEALTNGFFTVDDKWTVKYWNKAAEVILKVPAKDIVGKNLWGKFPGMVPPELREIEERVLLKDTPAYFHEYWGEIGSWFDIITYHCDDTVSVSFKSSKHRHIEYAGGPSQQLKVLTELYRFVTEITNDCLWEWNLESEEIFWIDGGHKRVFGYQIANALVPQLFWEHCIHPDDKKAVLAGLKKTTEQHNSNLWEAKYRFKMANGSYRFVHDRGHIIFDGEHKAVRIIGATTDITENVLLEEKLKLERMIGRKRITDAVLIAQEKERALIAIELNENLNQLLVAVKWNIHIAQKDEDKREVCLNNSVENLNKVITEIKKIYKTLLLPDLHIAGLFDNIRNLIKDMVSVNPVIISFHTGNIDEEEDITENMRLDIFRIVQEQLNNIIAHSKATHAGITLKKQGNEIVLAITDNGIGCDLPVEKNGVGIINIESRALLYDGKVTITSKPDKGYTLKVVLPCFPVQYCAGG